MAYSNITLTTQTGLSFITGEFIQLIHDSNNYMFGQIVSYNPSTGSLTFTPTRVVGSGTYSTWEIIASGAAGNDGTSGTSGINGTSGTSGVSGSSGVSGTSGSSGLSGSSGSSGINGTSGSSGLTGTSGTSGVNGTSGLSGTSGTSGVNGTSGTSGASGSSGSSGVNGSSGSSGTSGTSVSVSGTPGYVTYFNSATTITGSSNLFWDSANNRLGINQSTPLYSLDVTGTARFTGQLLLGSTITNGTYTYTLPGATGTLALTSDLSAYVTLATPQTITGAKTFTANTNLDGYVTSSNAMDITGIFSMLNKTGYAASTGRTILTTNSSGGYGTLTYTFGTSVLSVLSLPIGNYTYTFPSSTGTVALTSDIPSLSGYVPYVGATGSLYMGSSYLVSAKAFVTSGSGGGAYLKLLNALTAATPESDGVKLSSVGSVDLVISSNTYNSTLVTSGNTANRTYTFPNASGTIALTSNIPTLSGTAPISYSAGVISISQATTSTNGYLSSTDWNTFNSKQSALTNPVTGTGTSGQVTYFNGTSSVTGTDNFRFDGTNLSLGNPSSALANLYVYNGVAAASFLLHTGSSTDYSEIAVRNNGSTASSYFRQYSTATTGSDFGISRANLALFFSNYASNFAIGTRNGGDLIFGTNDTERARITSGGAIAIGNSTAFNGGGFGNVLSLYNSTAPAISLVNSSKQWQLGVSGTNFTMYDATNFVNVFVLNGSTGAATFSSSVTATGQILSNISSGVSFYTGSYTSNSLGDRSFGTYSGGLREDASYNLNFDLYDRTAATWRTPITIRNNGNVGIGTTSPFGQGSGYTSMELAGNTYGQFYVSANSASSRGTIMARASTLNDVYIASITNSPLVFGTNDAEKMRITSGGVLCVGTTSVLGGGGSEALTGFNVGQSGVIVNNSNSDYNAYFAKRTSYSYGGIIAFYAAGTQVGSITTNGTTTTYNVTSDYRLKQDLKDFAGLSLISAIKTYDYEWKSNKTRMYGVLAHELQEVLPYAVFGEKDGKEMQGVDYSKIVPVLVKAIQEQQAQIEELKAKINE
jgi:hypothetical protein